jgi:GT2 family glycosyltransferase
MKISFGIKTDMQEEFKLLITLSSIFAQNINEGDFEVIVTGNTDFRHLDPSMRELIRLIPDKESAGKGLLAKMMNTLAQNARGEYVCLLDDDIILLDGWYSVVQERLEREDFDVLAFPIKNTDGSRFYDWSDNPDGSRVCLIPYNQKSNSQYVTGGFVLFKRAVWEQVKWDNFLRFYEGEDLDWSRRVLASDFTISFCHNAFVVHNDWHYYQHGNMVLRHENLTSANKHVSTHLLEMEQKHELIRRFSEAARSSRSYRLGRLILFPLRYSKQILSKTIPRHKRK